MLGYKWNAASDTLGTACLVKFRLNLRPGILSRLLELATDSNLICL